MIGENQKINKIKIPLPNIYGEKPLQMDAWLRSISFFCVVFFSGLDILWGVKKLSVTHTKDYKMHQSQQGKRSEIAIFRQ